MYVGIDVGGTNLKAGLVDEQGRLLAVRKVPLGMFQGEEFFARRLAELAAQTAHDGGVAPETLEHIGIGVPGTTEGGLVLFTCNIPMKNVPLAKLVNRYLDVPVMLGNDADCAAVGEYFCGAGRGVSDFVVVTLGTGVGGGLILGGKLRPGSELGHIVTHRGGDLCNCGRRGCWERYASASGLIRLTREKMDAAPDSLLWELSEKGERVEGRTAFLAAERGDETAKEVCRIYVEELACGVIDLINLLRPEIVSLGGGVSGAPEDLLLTPLRTLVDRECYASHGGQLARITKAELGNDAGMIGAALLGKAI